MLRYGNLRCFCREATFFLANSRCFVVRQILLKVYALLRGEFSWPKMRLWKKWLIWGMSAEIQPFYVRRRFATSAAQMPLYEKSSWKIEQILCVQWSETKWQIGGGPMFFGYCAPNWLSSRPLSVTFLFRTSGKETDMATMLRLEKYGRIVFSPEKWTNGYEKTGQK